MAFSWLARESSSGDLYFVTTELNCTEEVYKVFGAEVYGMDVDDPNFDSGDVDIDIIPLPHNLPAGEAMFLSRDDEDTPF